MLQNVKLKVIKLKKYFLKINFKLQLLFQMFFIFTSCGGCKITIPVMLEIKYLVNFTLLTEQRFFFSEECGQTIRDLIFQ